MGCLSLFGLPPDLHLWHCGNFPFLDILIFWPGQCPGQILFFIQLFRVNFHTACIIWPSQCLGQNIIFIFMLPFNFLFAGLIDLYYHSPIFWQGTTFWQWYNTVVSGPSCGLKYTNILYLYVFRDPFESKIWSSHWVVVNYQKVVPHFDTIFWCCLQRWWWISKTRLHSLVWTFGMNPKQVRGPESKENYWASRKI